MLDGQRGRPRLLPLFARTLFAGLRHSPIGFARAAMMAVFYLHLERQTKYVVRQIDAQIREIEATGEEAFFRRWLASLQPASA